MGNLSPSLSRGEFACRCGCGFNTVDIGLIKGLQTIVDSFGGKTMTSIVITSGNRCVDHNAKEGGSLKSQHVLGKAADFKLYDRKTNMQYSPDRVRDRIDELFPSMFGAGIYSNRNHFDCRDNCARWDARYNDGC